MLPVEAEFPSFNNGLCDPSCAASLGWYACPTEDAAAVCVGFDLS